MMVSQLDFILCDMVEQSVSANYFNCSKSSLELISSYSNNCNSSLFSIIDINECSEVSISPEIKNIIQNNKFATKVSFCLFFLSIID